MGRISSSTRRKPSKKKKKSLKVSSEGYKKKKSRRNKSKKLRDRDDYDSFSSYSDDEIESTSPSLNSSSSSESVYKGKQARSRSRNEIKSNKKRSRRRYSSDDSSEDSSPVKKRKGSKKSKKIKKKKKKSLKRKAYISSASSDSRSCSTCKDEDSSSDEQGSHGRSRGRIGNRENEELEIEKLTNNPMRLKSVITVATFHNEQEDDKKNDELKEETVYEYDDCPSSKSNDSIELPECVKEVNSGSNINKEKESNVSDNVGSEADDLESILRQKALENLSRFRGGIKTKLVVVDDKPKTDQSDVKQLTTVNMTPVSQPVTHRSRFTWKRDPSVTTGKDVSSTSRVDNKFVHETAAVDQKLTDAVSSTSRVDNKFVNETAAIDQKSTAAVTATVSSESRVDNKFVNETAAVDQKSTAAVEGSSKEQQNESNDNSQFEKKTMSVIRGGEMVQVSYKVYIPNRAPALARRQLKR